MKTLSANSSEKSYREVTAFCSLRIPYASSASYIPWRSQCPFIISGRCQIVSSIASASSTKNLIPVTPSVQSLRFSQIERHMHLFCRYLTHAPTAQLVHQWHCPSVGLQIGGRTVTLLLLDLLSCAQCLDHLRPSCSPCFF